MMMGFGFFGMFLFWGVFLAFLVGGVALAIRPLTVRHTSGGRNQPTARLILDERFARGEIDREEYAAIRAQLA